MTSYMPVQIKLLEVVGVKWAFLAMRNPRMNHHKSNFLADVGLASKLIAAGDSHGKSMRGIIVYFELDCQIGWFVEWATYRVGIEVLSTSSTMLQDYAGMKGKDLAEAKQNNLANVVYHQTAIASYQALRRIYHQRRSHRHPDWKIFCDWIEALPYAHELITV